jgi:hypothetical protein
LKFFAPPRECQSSKNRNSGIPEAGFFCVRTVLFKHMADTTPNLSKEFIRERHAKYQ